MDLIWQKFTEWLKELLVSGIMDNVNGLFDNVNSRVAGIAGQVGATPQGWNSGVYGMIRTLSDNVILPIAGVVLAFVMTLELIQLITEKNNMHDVETVVLLSHKKPDSYIHIDVEFGEGEGKIPVDKIVQRAEQYKPKERVTYKRIKEYILEKYGFKVHTAYIAEVKRSLGLPMYDAPNAVEKLKQARKHPTPEKVEAIKDALHYFAVI